MLGDPLFRSRDTALKPHLIRLASDAGHSPIPVVTGYREG